MSSLSVKTTSTTVKSGDAVKKYFSLGFLAYRLSLSAVISGFCLGYDCGITSSAMLFTALNHFMRPLSDLWSSAIISIPTGAAAVSALSSTVIADRYGRKPTILLSCVVEFIGCFICAFSFSKVVLLIGRILLGFALGLSSVAVPIYVGESTPTEVRGISITLFQLMITCGFFVSSLTAGIFSYWKPISVGWRLMVGFTMIPATVEFICLWKLPESPRWLFAHGDQLHAHQVIEELYGAYESANTEIAELSETFENEKRIKEFVGDDGYILLRIFRCRYVFRALVINSLNHVFQQFTGINLLIYYVSTIFQGAGLRSIHEIIWISAAVMGVNFLATLISLLFIERFARRLLLMVSAGGIIVMLALTATSFFIINNQSIPTLPVQDTYGGYSYFQDAATLKCMNAKNCDSCVNQEECGFCKLRKDSSYGYCLPVKRNASVDKYWSVFGPCKQDLNRNVYEWETGFCSTKYTLLTIFSIGFCMIFFAIGFGPLPWVANTEYYPFWARYTCAGIATFFNWGSNLLVTLSYLSVVSWIGKHGLFYLYAGFTVIALAYMYLLVPETRGISLEKVETLFMTGQEKHLITYIYNLHNIERSLVSTVSSDTKIHRL